MAEDLSIKVKVSPDVSNVQGELNKLTNAMKIPVNIKLENIDKVKSEIASLAKDIDVGVRVKLTGTPDITSIENQLNGKHVTIDTNLNLDVDDTQITAIQTKLNEISKKLKLNLKVSDKKDLTGKLEAVANTIEQTFKVKMGNTLKVTQKTISAMNKDFGELKKKIDSIQDTNLRSKLTGDLASVKGEFDNLLGAGTGSALDLSSIQQGLAGLKVDCTAALQAEAKLTDQQEKLKESADKVTDAYTKLAQKQQTLKTDYGNLPDAYKTQQMNADYTMATGQNSKAFTDFQKAQGDFNATPTKENLKILQDAYSSLEEVVNRAASSVSKANSQIQKNADGLKQHAETLDSRLNRLTARYTQASDVNNTISGQHYSGLLGDVDFSSVKQAFDEATNAKSEFEKDMSQTKLNTYEQALEKLSMALSSFGQVATSAGNQVDSAFDRLPSSISSVESTLKTLNDTYRAQQNRGKADAGVEQTIKTYQDVLTRMRQIEAQSGTKDYQLFTDMFKEFTPQLQKAGVQINTFSDFLQALTSVATQAKASIGDLGNEFKQQQSIESLNKRLNNLLYTLERYVEINKKIQSSPDAMAEYTALKDDIQNALRSTDGAFKNTHLSKAMEDMSRLKTHMQEMGLEGQKLSQVFQNLFGQHFSTMVAMGALHLMQNSLQQIYQNVVDIDSAMTELKKVTDETSSGYEKFMDDATSRAKELGTTVTAVINSTADFARLGFNLQDAEKVSNAALLLKNVGDGIESIDDASSMVISSMQAFGVEANGVMRIVNEYNTAGNKFAISANGVGESIQRSGAALHAANNTLEESIALATAMNRVIQNPETVGRFAQRHSNMSIEYIYIGQTSMNIIGQDRGKTLQIKTLLLCG